MGLMTFFAGEPQDFCTFCRNKGDAQATAGCYVCHRTSPAQAGGWERVTLTSTTPVLRASAAPRNRAERRAQAAQARRR